MSEIDVRGFVGANNVKMEERFFVGKGIAEPRVILNADVDNVQRLIKRQGKTLYISMPAAHSLWAGISCMLFASEGILYRVISGQAISICSISGPRSPLFYVEANDKVYISNLYWNGVFDPATNAISQWGITQPSGPMLSATSGNLPAGTYYVCMTNVSGSELSGNGPISSITLAAEGGIGIFNRPADALVWATDSDEYMFYLVGPLDTIVDIPSVEPLPSFLCSPPPYLKNLCYAFGRIWGSVGMDVYYSMPFHLGLFKRASNRFSFHSEVTMIAKVNTGLFIGTTDVTHFLTGTEPDQMVQSDAGAGSIPGTLALCNNMPELGWTLGTPEKDFNDVPVWLTTEGVVVGAPSGKFFNVSKNKIKMGIPEQGAAMYRNYEGIIQFLVSFKRGATGSGRGFADPETNAAFENGKIETNSVNFSDMTSRAGFADTASCRVWRGGVEI